MPVDAALRATFRNFSTLFFLVAVMTVPLHVAHSYVFREVIALSELHPEIETFPKGRRVRNIGVVDLDRARTSYVVLSVLEVALLPLLVRAARHVVARDNPVPTVVGAYRALARAHSGSSQPWTALARALALAAPFGVAVALLMRATGLLLIEPLADEHAVSWVGLVEGTARAAGGAFVIGPLAYLTADRDT
jgi:hypothetical protein